MNETFYYKSPVGTICIRNDGEYISGVSFTAGNEFNSSQQLQETQAPASPIIKKCMEQLDAYFAGSAISFDLPLLQPGTDFQRSVWDELQKIPYGKTISYLSFSKKTGNVKAIRAIAAANGKNNIAIIVPCHRVIGSNGSLVGYAGELWRKKWLLHHEATFAHGVQTLFA